MAETKIPVEQLTDNYSTSEVAIGTWTDGRTIYRKCFTGYPRTSYPRAHGITGLTTSSMFLKLQMMVKDGGATQWRALPWLYSLTDANWAGGVYIDASNIIIQNAGSTTGLWGFDNSIVVLEYVK